MPYNFNILNKKNPKTNKIYDKKNENPNHKKKLHNFLNIKLLLEQLLLIVSQQLEILIKVKQTLHEVNEKKNEKLTNPRNLEWRFKILQESTPFLHNKE